MTSFTEWWKEKKLGDGPVDQEFLYQLAKEAYEAGLNEGFDSGWDECYVAYGHQYD